MNAPLREEAAWWDRNAAVYGFGINEVAPIYSNEEAVRKYLTKLDWMRSEWPFQERKSVQFWRCSTNLRSGSVRFSWNNDGGWLHRARIQAFAWTELCNSLDDLRRKVGPRWGYWFHLWLEGGGDIEPWQDLRQVPPTSGGQSPADVQHHG
jgi:hypothetical protein